MKEEKQVPRKEALELTFLSCFLQVMQNRTEDLSAMPKWYVQDVKKKGNLFKEAIDKKLNTLYGTCDLQELDQTMNIINMISDKVDECWEEYKSEFE